MLPRLMGSYRMGPDVTVDPVIAIERTARPGRAEPTSIMILRPDRRNLTYRA